MKSDHLKIPKIPDSKPAFGVVAPEVNKMLVSHLEGILAQAKAGRLRGYYGVFCWLGNGVDHGWVKPDITYGPIRMVGELQILLQMITQDLIDHDSGL